LLALLFVVSLFIKRLTDAQPAVYFEVNGAGMFWFLMQMFVTEVLFFDISKNLLPINHILPNKSQSHVSRHNADPNHYL